ncbi:TetR/AcrR family transcriptional regulator [Actinomadura sp. ATCC 31491]|uniref:TetR/AcrR family transcriptional regulator n=1 Tax=Actinomadura luzonensis TaxID=2805427 RepID=A0ABT0FV36_9ACTN|nr:TetR/AcrR family transcriptional regulator [Actinomadura luzonensis]MCK2216182.1 TetR/AcrR family transcriptional regulator [Actinomadura luzonensis]UKU09933.1 Luz11 [Actinomadura luzonensis]
MIQERAELTRNKIIHGAAEAFAERGFAGTSLMEIVQLSGTTKGALYFHFGSKDRLAEEIREHADEIWTGMERLASCRCDGRAAVQAMIDFTHLLTRNLARDVVFRAGLRLDGEGGTPRERWIPLLRLLLAEAAPAPESAEGVEAILVAFVPGLEALSRRRPDRLDARTITAVWRTLLPALTTAPSAYLPAGRPHPHPGDPLGCGRPAARAAGAAEAAIRPGTSG